MRPGSAERIALYRQRARDMKPLFENVPVRNAEDTIPLLPKNTPISKSEKLMDTYVQSIEQAIDVLTDGNNGEKALLDRINHHQHELDKLKALHKALFKKPSQKADATRNFTVDPKLENRIIAVVKESKKKPRCTEIASILNETTIRIGNTVAASQRLSKDSQNRVVLTDE